MLTKYQEHLLKLYKEIDEICTKFDIEYCAAGGTMIGAVRHRGFIPWDDDMDIYMTLKNWRKFMAACSQDGVLPPDRVLACQENDRSYHNVIGRYTDLSMTTIHKNQVLHDDQAGFVIDILTLDPIPNDKEAAKQYNRDVLLFSDLINGSMVYSYRFRANRFRFLYYRIKMKLFGADRVLQQVQNMITQYDEDSCDFYAMRWGGVPLIFPKDMIGDCSLRFKYEDIETRCPNKPFDYLVYHYGDEWMYVPPVHEQESHNSVAVFNTEVEYPSLKNEIYRLLDVKKTRRRLRTRQTIALMHENSWNDLKDDNLEIQKVALEMYFSRQFSKRAEEIEAAEEKKNYTALSEIFAEYVSLQNNRKMIGRFDPTGAYRFYSPILIELKPKWFGLLLLTLFHTGRIAVAKRFIDVYRHSRGELLPSYEELNNDILKFRQAVSAFALGRADEAVPLIDELYRKFPDSFGVISLQICRYTRLENIEDNKDKVKALAEHGLELFPGNPDFEKYLMDTEFSENREQVLLEYVYAYSDMPNGFMRLDIADAVRDNINVFFDYFDRNLTETYISEDLEEDEVKSEQVFDDMVIIGKPKADKTRYIVIELIDKLIEIVPDSAMLYDKKLELIEKIAVSTPDPIKRAELEYLLTKSVRKIWKKYYTKFKEGAYPEIRDVVHQRFNQSYEKITGSDLITRLTRFFYDNSEFEANVKLLGIIDEKLDEAEPDGSEYLYLLELKSRVLNRLGKSDDSRRCMLECIEKSDIPYLNHRLGVRLKNEVISIYIKLYSSYNNHFIHKNLELKGLSGEAAYNKSLKNKQRLIKFYKKQIDNIYPSVLRVISYLVKLNALDGADAGSIVKKNKIDENSKFSLRIVTAICQNFETMNLSLLYEECIEELDDDKIYRMVQ